MPRSRRATAADRLTPIIQRGLAGRSPEKAGEMFVCLMQEVVDQASELLSGAGIPVTHVLAGDLRGVLRGLVVGKNTTYRRVVPLHGGGVPDAAQLVNAEGYGLIAEDFVEYGPRHAGSYHYFGVRPSLGAVIPGRDIQILNRPPARLLPFGRLITESEKECPGPRPPKLRNPRLRSPPQRRVVGNGYSTSHLGYGGCEPGLGLNVQPDDSHDLCAIYAILFMLGGLGEYASPVPDLWKGTKLEFSRLQKDDAGDVKRVENNARVGLTKLYHALQGPTLYDREYTLNDLAEFSGGCDGSWAAASGPSGFTFAYSALVKTILKPEFAGLFEYWSNPEIPAPRWRRRRRR